MNSLNDLISLVRAGTALITIETREEARAIETFKHVITQALRPLYQWSITDGLLRIDMDLDNESIPPEATMTLQAIKSHSERGIYLLLDFHPYLRYAMTQRMLREIIARQGSAAHTIVLISPVIEIPPELNGMAVKFDLSLPSEEELAKLLRDEAFVYSREHGGKRVTIDNAAFKTIVRNLVGLNLADARRIARQLVFHDGMIGKADLPELAKLKFELLNQQGLLAFEYDTAAFSDIAGLERMKSWVNQRKPVFIGEPFALKLDPPKGLLLLGVQGCGKSLAAKAVAGGFGVPLVRLDFGALYNKFHGETEKNLRDSLKTAEALQPCVLWIDEIEKGLATSDSDDGVSRRVLGYLLTWMAERKAKVFLVATANQVEQLPAELLRKGRFDEIFFVDLPSPAIRAEVLRIHFEKRDIEWAGFELSALVDACEGFSGAEIEQAVVSSLYAAASANRRVLENDVLSAINTTRPLSVLMAEKVNYLREWAATRTVSAD